MSRQCTRTCCLKPATARLEYDYSASTVWLHDIEVGTDRTPFELCADHARSLSVPRGWELVDGRRAREAAPGRLAG